MLPRFTIGKRNVAVYKIENEPFRQSRSYHYRYSCAGGGVSYGDQEKSHSCHQKDTYHPRGVGSSSHVFL
jgi:hypothetical protein